MKAVKLLCCIALCAFAAPVAAQMTATQRTTSDGRPLASSLPAKGAARAHPHPMSFDETRQHVGDKIVLTTIYGDRKEGKVESVSGSTLRLRSSGGLGYAVTNFERANIRSITYLP
jgi:Tfp pilus assembly protein FimT